MVATSPAYPPQHTLCSFSATDKALTLRGVIFPVSCQETIPNYIELIFKLLLMFYGGGDLRKRS